jgi:hypothetical protein
MQPMNQRCFSSKDVAMVSQLVAFSRQAPKLAWS